MPQENYLVNGVVLDDPSRGWRLLAATLPRSGLTMSTSQSTRPGRDGFKQLPSTRGGVVPQFEVLVPAADWEELLAVFTAPALVISRDDAPGRVAVGSLKSSSSPKDYPRSGMVSAVFYVEIPDGAWRGGEEVTALFVTGPAGVTGSLFPGLSAPVQDAIVRFRGPLEDPQIVDPSGAFIAVDGTIGDGEFLRFESDRGRAWLTDTDSWTGGEEVSGLVDFGGPRGIFEITPQFTDPAERTGQVTLTQASYNTGSGFQVRGRAAFLT